MRHTRCSLLQVSSNRFSELSGMANSCGIALVRLTASKSFISTQGSEDGTYATVHLRFRFSFKACCEKVKRKSIKERLGGGGEGGRGPIGGHTERPGSAATIATVKR